MWASHCFVALAALALSSLPSTLAWGAAGHEIVATIAQIHLDPAVLPVLCDILYPPSDPADTPPSLSTTYPACHLASVATWADRVRGTPAYRWTAPLHYVGALDDLPNESCSFPGPQGWAGRRNINVLAAVGNKTGQVAAFLSGELGLQQGEQALKFLVHFVGDMHMPLHLTGKEKGGNGAKVTFDGRVSNLHSVWDNLLIAQALRTVPSNYSRPLSGAPEIEKHLRGAIYDPYVRRIMYEGFGAGSRASRFGDITEWLTCPASEDDESTASTWAVVSETLQRMFGLAKRTDSEESIVKRHRAMRPKHGKRSNSAVEMLERLWKGEHEEERWDDDVLCPYAWARAIHTLNCDFPIWPAGLALRGASAHEDEDHHACGHHESAAEEDVDVAGRPRPHPELLELDTPAYAGRLREEWVVERLLAMAGIRLAGILNSLVLGYEDGLPVMVRNTA